MTASKLNKYKTILYDVKGRPIVAQLDLRNKLMREVYEQIMEELEDRLDVQEAMVRDNDGEPKRPFDEFVQAYRSEKAE